MTLNLGVRAHDLNAQDIDILSGKIHQFGFQHIQFAPCKSFPNLKSSMLTAGLARHIKIQLAKQHISISVLGCYINMVASDPQLKQAELATFVRNLTLAKEFGASVVATETGSVGNGYCVENFTSAAFERVFESVKYLVTEAEKLGVMIALEAGVNHPIYSAQKMRELVDRLNSNNVLVILDVANLMTLDNVDTQAQVIEQAFTLLQDRLVAIHLKDFIVKDNKIEFVPFGQGMLLLENILTFVKKEKPYLYCLFENTKEPDLATAYRHVQQQYAQIEIYTHHL